MWSFMQAAQVVAQAALHGLEHVAGMPGATDAATALLHQGQAAAHRAAQKAALAAQKKAVEAAKERTEHLNEKRRDDLVNAAAVRCSLLAGLGWSTA